MNTIGHDYDPTPSFIHKTLTKIEGRPTHISLRYLWKQVKSNLRKIHSPLGNGTHGHLRLFYPLADYNNLPALNGTPWVDPVHPGAAPVIPPAAGTAQINRILTTYSTALNQTIIFDNTDKAILAQVMEAIDDTCYNVLEDPDDGYADIRLLDIVTHLNATYGVVTEDNLLENERNLHKKWSPTQPLEDLWKQLIACQAFAAAHDPISDRALVRAATTNLEASGVFHDALKKWRARPAAQQTWANCQPHFNAANQERLRSQKTTGEYAAQVDYAAKIEAIFGPTAPTEQILALLSGKTPPPQHPLINKENMPPPMYYCWSHGLGHNPKYTSFTCRNPQKGHRT